MTAELIAYELAKEACEKEWEAVEGLKPPKSPQLPEALNLLFRRGGSEALRAAGFEEEAVAKERFEVEHTAFRVESEKRWQRLRAARHNAKYDQCLARLQDEHAKILAAGGEAGESWRLDQKLLEEQYHQSLGRYSARESQKVWKKQ